MTESVERALEALRAGRPVLVTDSVDRENEGDVVLAAANLTEEWLAWTIRHSSGYLCAPMTEERADHLDLAVMVPQNQDPLRTRYTVTVDAATGVGTGISAADRTRTLRVLADPDSTAGDLIRPGHVVPLRARDGGVLVRPGHTEAAVDLCRLAGLPPVAAIAELVHDDGSMMRRPAIAELAAAEDLPVLAISDLIAWRQRYDRVTRVVATELPTPYGQFEVIGYRDRLTGAEHLALRAPGSKPAPGKPPLVRLHSECLTGDVFGSERCDCGAQLALALQRVAAEGGCVIYLRGQEGRGVGLTAKLQAYALQDQGLDTVDAQLALGLPVDAREYAAGAAILHDLALTEIRLLTNNPAKIEALCLHGITVEAEQHSVPPLPSNERYLVTKRDRMGHTGVIDPDIPSMNSMRKVSP